MDFEVNRGWTVLAGLVIAAPLLMIGSGMFMASQLPDKAKKTLARMYETPLDSPGDGIKPETWKLFYAKGREYNPLTEWRLEDFRCGKAGAECKFRVFADRGGIQTVEEGTLTGALLKEYSIKEK